MKMMAAELMNSEMPDLEKIQRMAAKVIKGLKKHGFKIQLYESITTNSVYIKLDYGVCNSIRISDHKGKKHLAYKYNLHLHRKGSNKHKTNEGFDRYYYSFDDVGSMVNQILKDRKAKIKQYGQANYDRFMENNYRTGQSTKGFWTQCIEI